MYSKIFLIGNLTANPEMNETQSGKAVCNFTVAASVGYGENKVTSFWKCTAWDRIADSCEKYLEKGSKVFIDGEIFQKPYTDKNGNKRVEIITTVKDIKFLSMKGENEEVVSARRERPRITELDENQLPF